MQFEKAKSQFGDTIFARHQLQAHLGVSESTTLGLINEWVKQGGLTRIGAGAKTQYAFFVILQVQSPYGSSIDCAKRGSIHIPLGKITVYGTGKVRDLTEVEKTELRQLKEERAGKLGPDAQREFGRSPEKQRKLKQLEGKQHNYERSQGNLQALLKIGIDPNSIEDAYRIISHLLAEAEKIAINTINVGETVRHHASTISGSQGSMKILSTWGVKGSPESEKLFYLETVIYSAR